MLCELDLYEEKLPLGGMCSEEENSPLVPICESEMLAKARPSAYGPSRLNQQPAWGGAEKSFQMWYLFKKQNHFSLLG